MGKWIGIVGKSFGSVAEFGNYLDTVKLNPLYFIPRGVCIHHTAEPSLAQRPHDLEPQHILNLQEFYRDKCKWSAGPHLFVDRQKIHVFTPLNRMGVHAKSFNRGFWGLEMLGNYDEEEPNSKVLNLAYGATALLLLKVKKDERNIKFHRQDPKTDKSCPGTKISYPGFCSRVGATLDLVKHPATHTDVFIKMPWASVAVPIGVIPAGGQRAMAPLGDLVRLLPEARRKPADLSAINSDSSSIIATWLTGKGFAYDWDAKTKTIIVR